MNLLPDPQREGSLAFRYALAVLATAGAVLLGLLLRPLNHPAVLSPFLLAVAVAALYGGIGPGAVASLLSVAALNYWFILPVHEFAIAASTDIGRVLIFLAVAAFITWLAGTIRNQRRHAMHAAAALRASEERFRLASEALAAFLYDWDLVNHRLEWFGGLEEILGYRRDEVSPDVAWYEAHIHPDDLPAAWDDVRAALDSNAPGFISVYRFRSREGHYVHVADRARIVRDEAGRATRILGGVSDISARLRMESERAELLERERTARTAAEAAARHRDDVLGIVSHDLRTPLAAISICASAASQNIEPSLQGPQRMLGSIKHAADSAERLIRDLMDVSSIESGRLAVDPHPEVPGSILEQVADMFSATATARGVLLETQLTPDLPPVRADAERVMQGLANLLMNSLRFTKSGGRIMLCAEPDPCGVRFAVEDTGAGIAPEDLPHVFDRFWQREHGNGGGSGLGLSILRGIVDAHGGEVRAESTPGKGSRFSFTLPAAS